MFILVQKIEQQVKFFLTELMRHIYLIYQRIQEYQMCILCLEYSFLIH